MLELKKGVFGYKNKIVLEEITTEFEKGKLYCLLGANGSGKTTMYRTILGLLPLLGGEILLDGTSINKIPREKFAKKVAYVPQYHSPPFPYLVRDVVMMGRGTHISPFSQPGKEDETLVREIMERMGIWEMNREIYTEISGGERQLVLIARALAQQTDYIFMDEPVSSLDYGNQMKVLREIRNLSKEGKGICFTSHNPEHGFLTEAQVLALGEKRLLKTGPAQEVITEGLLKKMYGIEAEIQWVKGKHQNNLQRIVTELEP